MRYYVYTLIDPRDLKPFYVGKGNANRRFQHMKKLPADLEKAGEKARIIRDIKDAGLKPQSIINGWYDEERDALNAEQDLIESIGLENLANQNLGGGGDRSSKRNRNLTPKQEGFARAIVSGSNQSDAYRACYNVINMTDKQVHEEASKLRSHPMVSQRIDDLNKPAVQKVRENKAIDLAYLLSRLEDALDLAEQTDQPGAMTSALKEMSVLTELRPVEKREQTNINVTDLSERIQQGRARLVAIKGGRDDDDAA